MIRTLGASRISHKLQFARESVVRFGGLGSVDIWVAGDPGSDELSSVDVATDGWDIRARWFGVICVTPRLGVPDRGITIAWRGNSPRGAVGGQPTQLSQQHQHLV